MDVSFEKEQNNIDCNVNQLIQIGTNQRLQARQCQELQWHVPCCTIFVSTKTGMWYYYSFSTSTAFFLPHRPLRPTAQSHMVWQ